MYLSTAPAPAPPGQRATTAGAGGLRPTRVVAREFGPTGPYAGDPMLEEYLSDMTALYGLPFQQDRYAAGPRVPFTTIAGQLLADLDQPDNPLDGPLDLIGIAHSGPDCDPRRVTACYLRDLAPGEPLGFAVSDQGLAAPFSALRLLGTYARGRPRCRALLVVLEQTTLPYEVIDAPYPVPTRDVGVAILLDTGSQAGGAVMPALASARGAGAPGGRPVGDHSARSLRSLDSGPPAAGGAPATVRQRSDVPREQAAAELADLLGDDDVTVLVDPGLAPALTGFVRPIRVAPAELGCVAVWWALADEWTARSRLGVGGRVALAAHDPLMDELCVTTIEIPPGRGGAG